MIEMCWIPTVEGQAAAKQKKKNRRTNNCLVKPCWHDFQPERKPNKMQFYLPLALFRYLCVGCCLCLRKTRIVSGKKQGIITKYLSIFARNFNDKQRQVKWQQNKKLRARETKVDRKQKKNHGLYLQPVCIHFLLQFCFRSIYLLRFVLIHRMTET